jgi:hypothetical protein
MSTDEARLTRLREEIELRRAILKKWRDEVEQLNGELTAFAQQYDRVVGSLEEELDMLRQQIESLQYIPPPEKTYSLWGEYDTLEEAFDAKYRHQPQEQPIKWDAPKQVDDGKLKALYRKLARQFHPDLTSDPAEKQLRTTLMAQINAAYHAKNYKELQALEQNGGKPERLRPAPTAPPPPAPEVVFAQTAAMLVTQIHKLNEEIDWMKIEHQRLMTSPLMQMKIEASVARSRGRDFLRDMGVKLRADLAAARQQLAELRNKR